jgi:hypothetical protein
VKYRNTRDGNRTHNLQLLFLTKVPSHITTRATTCSRPIEKPLIISPELRIWLVPPLGYISLLCSGNENPSLRESSPENLSKRSFQGGTLCGAELLPEGAEHVAKDSFTYLFPHEAGSEFENISLRSTTDNNKVVSVKTPLATEVFRKSLKTIHTRSCRENVPYRIHG